jgi:hypothetical protein
MAPEGLEIYLDAEDIAAPGWLATLRERIRALPLPGDFAFLVEGPIRSLDGEFFDLANDNAANREVLTRLAEFGAAVGAHAACIHLIAPTDDLSGWRTDGMLERCVSLTERYVDLCRGAGMVATVENVPPIARMRESRYMTSPVGCTPSDLNWLADRVPGLRFTVDTSHAQLFINAAIAADVVPRFASIARACGVASTIRALPDYVAALSGSIETAHVSDAEGLLGEGLPYGEGSAPLDQAVGLLLREARWIVTEVLEPDPNRSSNMRRAETHIATLRQRAPVAS